MLEGILGVLFGVSVIVLGVAILSPSIFGPKWGRGYRHWIHKWDSFSFKEEPQKTQTYFTIVWKGGVITVLGMLIVLHFAAQLLRM